MNIAVVGLSHKTAPVEVREKLSIPEPVYDQAIAALCNCPHVQEVAVLSTCNRLEIYLVTSETESGIRDVIQFLSEHSKLPISMLRPYLFTLLHQDAVTHLMRVASGLDSLVLGEGQILAQVKHCHKMGQQHNGVGRILNQLFKQGISAGKRVRTETSIGTGAVSISSAAVELAHMKADLAANRITIVGAGKMSRLLVQHLISKGARNITILNRSLERAQELANQFPDAQLTLRPLSEMMVAIAASDLVFTSTSSTEPIVDRAKLESQLEPRQPLMLFDIAVPRNVDADVNEMTHVKAFNVDDLKAVVAQNQESRRQMAMEAEAMLEEEVDTFDIWWRSLETVSTISSLRDKVETIRAQELEKALSRLGNDFGDRHREVIEALTKGIVNKILHDPMVQLRAQQDIEARRRAMETLEVLFNLTSEQASV
ncbi:glutamyl-tRNA reductase [Myxacorys almedinensis]|uniref:Glutamyl-tRNA reductase n=1 Tax=Myxacorys almedinensis A TaxID=2690445 RepID=A0A8J8CM24_9CYAN|nr:glutamyl-tRNA reductase [Myxacorys almedinensis]NDJ18305.1 glutamyl-tRNA reductase [Myxacorys almedinensis A]